MSGCWVFGYGSLVDPSSFGATIGRELRPGIDFLEAELVGFGRRWNYGVLHASASGPGPGGITIDYTLVALGVVRAEDESVNGVVGWVEEDELALLDRRERHYDRVDVTDRTTVHRAGEVSGTGVRVRPPPRGDRAVRTGPRRRPCGDRAALLGLDRSRIRGVRPRGPCPVPQHHA